MFRALRKLDGQPIVINLSHVTDIEPLAGKKGTVIRMLDRVEIHVIDNFYKLTSEMGCLHGEKIGDPRWQ